MKRLRFQAFTLVELLVVIMIMGLLIALMLPALQGAWQTWKRTQCATNLYRIGQAYGVQVNDVRLGWAAEFAPWGWTGALLPYLENQYEVLICPEDDRELEGWNLSQVGDPISEVVEFKTVSGGGTFYDLFDAGRWVVKFSDTQFWDAKSKGLLSNADSANNLRSKYDCTYVLDTNPNRYWLCHEDYGGDEDYKDLMVKVVDNGDATVTLSIMPGWTAHRNYLLDKRTGEQLGFWGAGSGKASDANTITDELTIEGASAGGMMEVLNCSYGMNRYVKKLGGGEKILAMDYACIVVSPVHIWTDENLDADQDGVPDFARHRGRVNVLFLDGSVKAMDPWEIDPESPSVARHYWEP